MTSLVAMIYQDLKSRAIHWIFILLLSVSSGLLTYLQGNLNLYNVGVSLTFVIVLFSVVFIFLYVKNGNGIRSMKESIGLGDVLYLLAIIPLFHFRNYILYIIAGMFASILIYALTQKVRKEDTVPLAGYLSMLLLPILIYQFYINPTFLNIPIF